MDIADIRKKLGLTQEQLAAKLGVASATVRRWEHRRVSPSPLAKKAIEKLLEESTSGQRTPEES